MKKIFAAVAITAMLVACGSGSDSTETERYVGIYDKCDNSGTEVVLVITEPSANVLNLDYTTNTYQFGSCSGTKLSSEKAPATIRYEYKRSEVVNSKNYPSTGNWNNVKTWDIGNSVIDGEPEVVGLLLEDSSFYFSTRKVATSGGFYFDAEEYVRK